MINASWNKLNSPVEANHISESNKTNRIAELLNVLMKQKRQTSIAEWAENFCVVLKIWTEREKRGN